MKTKSKDMTTKRKSAKGLKPREIFINEGDAKLERFEYKSREFTRNPAYAKAYGFTAKFLLLDASDAGREALAADLIKIISQWLFGSGENELPMNAILSRLGYRPAGAKKGKTKL